jgi:hypothetical protein
VGGGAGVQLGSFGTSATNWPIAHVPSNYEDEEFGGLMIGRETEVLGENLSQCHFVHHKFHKTCPVVRFDCFGLRWGRMGYVGLRYMLPYSSFLMVGSGRMSDSDIKLLLFC